MKVFISYSRTDEDAARSISGFLRSGGIDVYVDINDRELGIAVSNHDAKNVVSRIENALAASSHLLAIVSEKTKGSWWVPFEVGAARARAVNMSTIVLDGELVLPEYLQIVPLIRDRYDLRKWLGERSTVRLDEAFTKSASASVSRLPEIMTTPIQYVRT